MLIYTRDMVQEQRGKDLNKFVMDGTEDMVRFIGSFALGGKIAGEVVKRGGKLLGRKVSKEAAEKAANKFLSRTVKTMIQRMADPKAGFLMKSGAALAGGTGRFALGFPAFAPMTASKALQDMIPASTLRQLPDGDIKYLAEETPKDYDDMLPYILDATGDTYIEIVSEHSGGALAKGAGNIMRGAKGVVGRFGQWTRLDRAGRMTLDKLRQTKLATMYSATKWRMLELGESFAPAWNRTMALFKKGGFDGVFAEMGEEDVGRVMRAASGISYPDDMSLDERLKYAWEESTDIEGRGREAALFTTLPVATVAGLGVVGGIRHAAGTGRRRAERKRVIEQEADAAAQEREEAVQRGTEQGQVARKRRYTPQQIVYGVAENKDQDEAMEVLSGVKWSARADGGKGGFVKADGTPLSRTEFAELTGGVRTSESEDLVTESGKVFKGLGKKAFIKKYVGEIQRLKEQREAREREEVSPTGTPREEREDPVGGAEFDKPEEAEAEREELSDEEHEKRLVEGTFGGGSTVTSVSVPPPDTPGITEEEDVEEGQMLREMRTAAGTLGVEGNLFLVDPTVEETVPGVYDDRTGNIYLPRPSVKRAREAELKKDEKDRKDPTQVMRELVEETMSHEWTHRLSRTDPKAWEELREQTLPRQGAVDALERLIAGTPMPARPTEEESAESPGAVIFSRYVQNMKDAAEAGDPGAGAFMRNYNSLLERSRSTDGAVATDARIQLADLVHEEATAGWIGENLSKMGFWSKLAKKDAGLFRRVSDFFRRLYYRIADAPAFRAIDNAIRRAEQRTPQAEEAKRKDKIEVPPLAERDVLFAAPRREAFTDEDMRTAQTTFRAGAFSNKRIVVDHVAGKVARWGRAGQPDVLNYGAGRVDGLKHSERLRELGANVVSHDFPDNMATWPEEERPPSQDPMRHIRRKHDLVFASAVLNTIPSREGVEAAIAQIANATRARGTAVVNYPQFGKHPLSGVPVAEVEGMLNHYFGKVQRVNRDNASPMYEASLPKRAAVPAGPLFAARKIAKEPRKLSKRFELVRVKPGTELADKWGEDALYMIDHEHDTTLTSAYGPMAENDPIGRTFWTEGRGTQQEFRVRGRRYVTESFFRAYNNISDQLEGVEGHDTYVAPVLEIGGEEYTPQILPPPEGHRFLIKSHGIALGSAAAKGHPGRTHSHGTAHTLTLYSAPTRQGDLPFEDPAFDTGRLDDLFMSIYNNRSVHSSAFSAGMMTIDRATEEQGGFRGGYAIDPEDRDAVRDVIQEFPGLQRDILFFADKSARMRGGFGDNATFIVISTGNKADDTGVAHHLLVQTSSLPFDDHDASDTISIEAEERFGDLLEELRGRGINVGNPLYGHSAQYGGTETAPSSYLQPYDATVENDDRPKLLLLGTHFVDMRTQASLPPFRHTVGLVTRPYRKIGDFTDHGGANPFMRVGAFLPQGTGATTSVTDAMLSDIGNTIVDLLAMSRLMEDDYARRENITAAVGIVPDGTPDGEHAEQIRAALDHYESRREEAGFEPGMRGSPLFYSDVYEGYSINRDRGYPVAGVGMSEIAHSADNDPQLSGQVAGIFHRPGISLTEALSVGTHFGAGDHLDSEELEEIVFVLQKQHQPGTRNPLEDPDDFMSIRLVKVRGDFGQEGEKVWLPTHVKMTMRGLSGSATVQRTRVNIGDREFRAAGPMFIQGAEHSSSLISNVARIMRLHNEMEDDHLGDAGMGTSSVSENWQSFIGSVNHHVPNARAESGTATIGMMRTRFWSALTDEENSVRQSVTPAERVVRNLFASTVNENFTTFANMTPERSALMTAAFPNIAAMNIINGVPGKREVAIVLKPSGWQDMPGQLPLQTIGVRETTDERGKVFWSFAPVRLGPLGLGKLGSWVERIEDVADALPEEHMQFDLHGEKEELAQKIQDAIPLMLSSSRPLHFMDVLQKVHNFWTPAASHFRVTSTADVLLSVTPWREVTEYDRQLYPSMDPPITATGEEIIEEVYAMMGAESPDADISSDEFWTGLKSHPAIPDSIKKKQTLEALDKVAPTTSEKKRIKAILNEYFRLRFRELGIEDNPYLMNAMRNPSGLGNLTKGEAAPQQHVDFYNSLLSDASAQGVITSWMMRDSGGPSGTSYGSSVGTIEGAVERVVNGASLDVYFLGGAKVTLEAGASIYIASIKSTSGAHGRGSQIGHGLSGNGMMEVITKAADASGAVVTGYPSAFGQMTQGNLIRWYGMHGYEPVFIHKVADHLWSGLGRVPMSWYGWRHPRPAGWEIQPRGTWGFEERRSPPRMKRDETPEEFTKRLEQEGVEPFYFAAQNRTLEDLKITIPEVNRIFQTAGYKTGRSMARTKDRLNFMQLDPDHVGPAARILEDRVGVAQVNKDLQRMWDEVLGEMPEWQGKDGKTQFKEADGALKDKYKFQLPNGWEKKFPTAGDFFIGSVAMRDEFRYWYERYVTASRQYLDLTDHEWDVFNKVLAATSQRTNVKDNMERTLSIMSEIFGNRFGSTDVISNQSIRNALDGQLGTEDQLKTGSFNTTFEFIAGRGSDVPLSTNDAIMAAVFNIPGNAFGDSFWYESVSRYMIKMADYLNSIQGSEYEPYQSWQLQALMWVNRDDDRSTQTYVQTLENFIERAIQAGVMNPGEKITPQHLADPEMSDIARSGKISHFNRTPRGLYTLAGSGFRPVQRANLVRELLTWGMGQGSVPEKIRTTMQNKILKGYDAIWRSFSKALSRSQPYKRPLDSGIRKGGDILTELFSSISGLKAGYTAVLSRPEVTRASRVTPATTGGAVFSEDAHSAMTVPFWNVDSHTRQMVNALIGRASGAGAVESLRMEVIDEDSGLDSSLDGDEIGYTTAGLFIKNLAMTENDARWVGGWIRENVSPGFRLVTEVNWSGTQVIVVAPKTEMMGATPRRQPTIGISQENLVDAVFNTIALKEDWSEEEFTDRVRPTLMRVIYSKSSDQLNDNEYDAVIDRGLEQILDEDTRNNGEQLFRGIKGYSGTSKSAEPIRLIVKDAAKRKRRGFENQLRRLIQRPEQFLSEVDWEDIQKRTSFEDDVEGKVREALGRYSRYIRAVDAIGKLGSASGSFQSRLDQFSDTSLKLLERTESALNKADIEFDYRSMAQNNTGERVSRIPDGVFFSASRRRSENLANPATDQGARDLVDSVDRQSRELLNMAGLREWRNMNRDEIHTQKQVEDEGEERLRKNGLNRERDLLVGKMELGRTFTDTDTYVAKKLINHFGVASIQSGNVDELKKTIALTEGYRDIGTEMARAFRQRFDPIETPRQRRRRLMTEGLLRPSVRLQRKIERAKKDKNRDLLKALRDAIAEENLKLFNELTKLGYDLDKIDEYATNPRSAFEIIRIAQTFKASFRDKAYEWYINALLSGISTQVANVVGTVPLSIWEYGIKRPLEAVISTPIRKGERVTFREIKHMWGAFWPSMKKAARVAMLAHDTEVPQLEVMLGRGVQGLTKYEIPRVSTKHGKGRFIRSGFTGITGTRMLLAVDEFMKTVISGMEVAGLAQREMVSKEVWKKTYEAALASGNSKSKSKNMADHATSTAMAELIEDTQGLKSDIWDRSMDMAHLLTFQTELGNIGKKTLAWRDSSFVFQYIVPFAKTLMNITKLGLFPQSHYSALGFVNMPKEIWDLYLEEDPKSKTGLKFKTPEERDWSKVSSRAIGQAGNFVAFMALYALLDGDDEERPWVTGSRDVWEYKSRLTGMREGTAPPMSFAWPVLRNGRIDKGPYISYANVEPISTIFGFATDVINAVKSGDPARMMKEIPMSLSAQVFEKNLTRGISDFLRIFEEPDVYGPKYLAHFVTGWIPGVYKRAARADREYMPERRVIGEGLDWVKSLGQRTVERTELSRHIFPDLIVEHPAWDVWGKPIPSDINPVMQSKTMNWLYRATMPFHTQYADEFPMDVVIRKWNGENNSFRDQVHFYPIKPEWKDKNDVKHYMTPEQLDQVGELAGKIAREVAKMEMPVIDWSKPTTKQDADAVKSVVNDSRKLAKDTLSAVWQGETTKADSFASLAEALHEKHIVAQATVLARTKPSRKSLGKWKKKAVWDREVEEWEENKKLAATWLRNRGMKRKEIMKAFPRTKGKAARVRLSRSLSKAGFKSGRGTGVPVDSALQ